MLTVYKFDIERADRAGDLHQFQADINADENLSPDEKAVLSELIRAWFGLLNARLRCHQTARWP